MFPFLSCRRAVLWQVCERIAHEEWEATSHTSRLSSPETALQAHKPLSQAICQEPHEGTQAQRLHQKPMGLPITCLVFSWSVAHRLSVTQPPRFPRQCYLQCPQALSSTPVPERMPTALFSATPLHDSCLSLADKQIISSVHFVCQCTLAPLNSNTWSKLNCVQCWAHTWFGEQPLVRIQNVPKPCWYLGHCRALSPPSFLIFFPSTHSQFLSLKPPVNTLMLSNRCILFMLIFFCNRHI